MQHNKHSNLKMLCLRFSNLILSKPNTRFLHKYVYKMEKAYLRHLNDNEQFQITFQYVNKDLKVNRQFNFCRKLTETVDSFLNRVTTNVEKIANKKNKKKKTEGEASASNIIVSLLNNDTIVEKDIICNDLFKPENNIKLTLQDTDGTQKYDVIINSPWVDGIALPNSILATYTVYPSKFDSVYTEKELSEFVWSKSKDKTNWTEVGTGFSYTPSNEDIGYYLKLSCTPRNERLEGPMIEAVSTCIIDAGPGKCPFDTRQMFTQSKLNGKEFRVVTYNILADLYCDSDYTREVLHPYCPAYALNIDYRKQLIVKEITGYNADLICLQEVDRKVYNYDLEPILSHLGYTGNFATKGRETAEGLGFFCKKNRFKILESHRHVFSENLNKDPVYADIWEKISKNEKLSERILDRTTTMQINLVESLENEEILLVANVHFYFHPDADHIRLIHGGSAIRFLEHFKNNLQNKHKKRISLLLCGDFNSTPECGVYKLYTTGHVPPNFIDYQSNKEQVITDLELNQSIKLDSACGTPQYTNFTVGFADCLDYIYYEKTNLEVSQVVPFPTNEELTVNTALPSIVFPSDHIALISDLKWL